MHRAALVFVIGVVGLGGAAASADWIMDSVLQGDLGTLNLHAWVTYDGGTSIYDYSYELVATATLVPVHYIDLGNPYSLYFWDAYNDAGFQDPVYQPYLTSMIWEEGNLLLGEAVLFGFSSYDPPTEVSISAFDHGQRSIGPTLGMIPEPSLGFAVMAAVGALALLRRR